jgi:hypothetical protein
VRLFDALTGAPGRTKPLLALTEDAVSKSASPQREDNARRAVHEVAKALRDTLRRLSAQFGAAIGYVSWVTWGDEEGDSRTYRLEVAASNRSMDARTHRRVAEARSAAKRLVELLADARPPDAACAFQLQRTVELLQQQVDDLLRHLKFTESAPTDDEA